MSVSCPIDIQRVDQSVVRITAGLVAVLAAMSLLQSFWGISIFLVLDFLARGTGKSSLSLLSHLSRNVAQWVGVKPEMVNAGPKKFAAKIGFLLCLALIGCALTEASTSYVVLCCVLIFCATLESLLSVCIGCHLYQFVRQFPTSKREGV